VDLRAAADEFGVKPEDLTKWVEALAGLERRLGGYGGIIGDVHAYSADDGILTVGKRNWVRDMQNVTPTVGEAVRLLIIATQYVSVMGKGAESDSLRSALRKIERIVGPTYKAVVRVPEYYVAIDQNIIRDGMSRSLDIRYVNANFEVRDRTIEPWDLYAISGHWYVKARDPEETDPERAVKIFRLDRISKCENGTYRFTAPERDAIPESFDLSDMAKHLTVRVYKAFLDAKPDGVVIGDQRPCHDGRIEVDLTVYGERRLDHVLVAIGPEAEVVAPEEYRARRAAHAAALLDHLG
jgi:predicted DNA-binding transcriptional regulator YafY